MAAPLADAAKAALKSALERVYDGAKLHPTVVAALVAYFAGRGEALTDLSFDYPQRGSVDDFERRWLAKLRSATITDEGDQVDFILWTKARTAPSSARGAEAKGLAKVALIALEEAGERPSAAALSNLEKAQRVETCPPPSLNLV